MTTTRSSVLGGALRWLRGQGTEEAAEQAPTSPPAARKTTKNPALAPGETVQLIAETTVVSPAQVKVFAQVQEDGSTRFWPEERSRGLAVDVYQEGGGVQTYLSYPGRPVEVPVSDPLNTSLRIGVTSPHGVPSRHYPGSKPLQDVEYWGFQTHNLPVRHAEEEDGRVFWNERS